MDEPVTLYGPAHRQVRHNKDQALPKFAVDRYGEELARNIMLDHLIADSKEEKRAKREEKIKIYEAKQLEKITPIQEELTVPQQHPPESMPHTNQSMSWSEISENLLKPDQRLKTAAGIVGEEQQHPPTEERAAKPQLTWAQILERLLALDARLRALEEKTPREALYMPNLDSR